jgi:hypothetical protein
MESESKGVSIRNQTNGVSCLLFQVSFFALWLKDTEAAQRMDKERLRFAFDAIPLINERIALM